MRRFAMVMISLMAATTASALEPVMPRYPALSPNGDTLVFSWQGDLWVAPSLGGSATRLTANPGYDHHPVFTPDGHKVLFVSDRDGGDDVFLADLVSGTTRRLTFHESADIVQGSLADDFVFTSRRHEAWDRMPAVYRAPLAGGTERLAISVLAVEAVPSPDGTRIALVRGGTPADRRHYRGAANRDLWLLTLASGKLDRLTETEWDEDGVSWAGAGALVFRSDNGGNDRQLFHLDLASGRRTQLTHHEGVDVRAPRTSGDGRIAAYELWDAIFTVPTDGSTDAKRLSFDVPADAVEASQVREVVRADAEEIAVSPDGTQVAIVLRGDIFIAQRRMKDLNSVAEPPTVRVTETPARERHVAWSPDGMSLIYDSDRFGQLDLFSVRPRGRDDGRFTRAAEFVEKRVTASSRDESQPTFSPDGTKLAFVVGKGGLAVAAADGKDPRVLFDHWGRIEFAWSPDSRWLAFAREDQHFNMEVFLIPADGGAEINISMHPASDGEPVFSPDGRKLYFRTDRHGRTVDLWMAVLSKADWQRSPQEWLDLYEDEAKVREVDPEANRGEGASIDDNARVARPSAADTGRKASATKRKPTPRPIVIDREGIHERVRALTTLPGDEGEAAVTPDGHTVVFVAASDGERDLYKIRWDGKELKRLTQGGSDPTQLSLSRNGKTVFFRTGKGAIGVVDLEGKTGDPAPFAARFQVDRAAWRAQVFDEAWRELNHWFADEAFHGHDWAALRDRYRPLALQAQSRRDFDDAINLMLGELNASHMGFRPPATGPRTRTGDLGVELAPALDGRGVTITQVLAETPAARTDVGLVAGDKILAIDGREVGPRDNAFDVLADTAGQRIALKVAGKTGERTVTLVPARVEQVREARYQTWVRERRALVDVWSSGRLGYIHIQGMDAPSLEDFERDLYAAANGKQGLLIDVRNNGGGWTTDYLMAILTVRRHAWTVPRDGDPAIRAYPGSRLPLPAWTRPAAALCDEASYSNAEIFSWAFRTLKRGTLVGMPTFGAVMSTGAARLVDGSVVRLPSRRWYVAGSDIDQENHGCPPDVRVEQPPQHDLASDADAQLAKGVEVLLSQLPEDPAQLPW